MPDAVAALTIPFAYNDISELSDLIDLHKGEVAAIIIEPMGIIEPNLGI